MGSGHVSHVSEGEPDGRLGGGGTGGSASQGLSSVSGDSSSEVPVSGDVLILSTVSERSALSG